VSVSEHESSTEREIASQPACWREAASLAPSVVAALGEPGERVAFVGCGTSWFMGQAAAVLRESVGLGESDAFLASEMPHGRRYDRVVAISRSGTTSEVIAALAALPSGTPTVAIVAVAGMPIERSVDRTIVLGFADERSVVQTRFATTALALLRSAFTGDDLADAIADAETVVASPAPSAAHARVQFLGTGWRVALAYEAALKVREAAQAWSEAYPAMDYRHGPIALADPGTLVWFFGEPPAGLVADVAATGATVYANDLDPLAQLVAAQRLAVALARAKGLDPDHPRNLSRSVILPPAPS
jgi:fructoselysine-6-P-deglycase FrlB-like protein